MPDAAFLVVPTGAALPPEILAKTVEGFRYEVNSLENDIAVETAVDVFHSVERDIYQIDLNGDADEDYELDQKVGEGENLAPDAAWSAVFHTYPGDDDVFVTVHRDGQMGQVIFCAIGEGDVRLQLGSNYEVNERCLIGIRDFGRLVRAINGGK